MTDDDMIDRIDLAAAIRSLTAAERRVMYLYYYCGYTQRELAEMMGCSRSQISKSLRRCREKLRRYYMTN